MKGLVQPQSFFGALVGVVMKFCQVVLIMTLGMTGEMVLGAQMLPAGSGDPSGKVPVAIYALP